jgi:hypothetical protein
VDLWVWTYPGAATNVIYIFAARGHKPLRRRFFEAFAACCVARIVTAEAPDGGWRGLKASRFAYRWLAFRPRFKPSVQRKASVRRFLPAYLTATAELLRHQRPISDIRRP